MTFTIRVHIIAKMECLLRRLNQYERDTVFINERDLSKLNDCRFAVESWVKILRSGALYKHTFVIQIMKDCNTFYKRYSI